MITADQLETLRRKAEAAGDAAMVRTVDDALESDCEWTQADALAECERALGDIAT